MGQRLVGISLVATSVVDRLRTSGQREHLEPLQSIIIQLRECQQDLRRILEGKCPANLEQEGLAESLRKLVRRVDSVGSRSLHIGCCDHCP